MVQNDKMFIICPAYDAWKLERTGRERRFFGSRPKTDLKIKPKEHVNNSS